MSACAHVWYIAGLNALTRTDASGLDEPFDLRCRLRCSRCRAELLHLSPRMLREQIEGGHVSGASLAQWASVCALFR